MKGVDRSPPLSSYLDYTRQDAIVHPAHEGQGCRRSPPEKAPEPHYANFKADTDTVRRPGRQGADRGSQSGAAGQRRQGSERGKCPTYAWGKVSVISHKRHTVKTDAQRFGDGLAGLFLPEEVCHQVLHMEAGLECGV